MSSDEKVRFQFNFRGVDIEIAGERQFVDEMYQELMRDIEAARRGMANDEAEAAIPDEDNLIWVHRCSDMMRKIYMATPDDVRFTLLSNSLNPAHLSTLYVDKHVFDRFLPNLADEHTLWAELTEEGRKKINGENG